MNGLRVYVDSPRPMETSYIGTEPDDAAIPRTFYTRRGNGPIYRWLYEASKKHWRVLRLNISDFDPHKLSNASWKSVPDTLRSQLGAHYLD